MTNLLESEITAPLHSDSAPIVMLADGSDLSLAGMSPAELSSLQWEQEPRFARAIQACPKGSRERSLVTAQAYDTICAILAAQNADHQSLSMGMDQRYVRLVLGLLYRQVEQGFGQPSLFEVGYGSGTLLKEVREVGFYVGGIEASAVMRDQAIHTLGQEYAHSLLCGNFCDLSLDSLEHRPTLVYWNDVFEHICPDEILDYLSHIYDLLMPGGLLVTITPNWLLRPSDVTGDFQPPRTEPVGFHFKEYRLSEVSRLLKQAGFRRVATPLAVSRNRVYLCGGGLRLLKQLAEPLIDRLPVKLAHLACRGAGMSYTIATKPR